MKIALRNYLDAGVSFASSNYHQRERERDKEMRETHKGEGETQG